MSTIHKTILWLFLLCSLLTACAAKTDVLEAKTPIPSVLASTQDSLTQTPTLEVNETATSTRVPTVIRQPTATSTNIFMNTPTLELSTETWENFPNLSEVVLTKQDIEAARLMYADKIIQEINESEKIETCLWDCVKYYYSGASARWTIMLLRAGDDQKALNTAQNLKANFLEREMGEYPGDAEISKITPDSWLLIYCPENTYYRTAATGFAFGNVVIMVTESFKFCYDDPDFGRYCEGDLGSLANDVTRIAQAQIDKLVEAGYPE